MNGVSQITFLEMLEDVSLLWAVSVDSLAGYTIPRFKSALRAAAEDSTATMHFNLLHTSSCLLAFHFSFPAIFHHLLFTQGMLDFNNNLPGYGSFYCLNVRSNSYYFSSGNFVVLLP